MNQRIAHLRIALEAIVARENEESKTRVSDIYGCGEIARKALAEDSAKSTGRDRPSTGRDRPVPSGIERTLLIALLRRARDHLPGTAGDPSVITDEMLDPEESGSTNASRAQLALDIEHTYVLLEIDP